ncbi:MAG: 4Fe-4S binding protein [Ruminococcaceae bacterium]|nr:4Fe-4S binding protein [Oscillospiraceae bacterium]
MLASKSRGRIQLVAALLQNADLRGFFTGKIYQGKLKSVCVPGLNCYSCPGALGACPIGSLQNFLGSRPFRFPYYVVGLLLFFGAVLGRAICGFLCPFGFVQELLHKLPLPRKKLGRFPGDRPLRWVKYAVLALMVVVLPIVVGWTPVFCKYLCPAGTLEGGIPLVLIHGGKLRLTLGTIFYRKATILVIVLVACLFIFRPFCKYLCPLGAIYGVMNRFALYRMHVSAEKCVGCGACARACPMQVDPVKTPNGAECIRCGACVAACPKDALRLGFRGAPERAEAPDAAAQRR